MKLKQMIFAAGALAAPLVLDGAAQAQTIRAQPVDPVQQRLTAIEARLEDLSQSAGAQVVVITQTMEIARHWPANTDTWPNNNARAQDLCQEALGDRFGRVISRERTTAGDRYFLSRVVCETRAD
ncbi:hypothetical protein [Brevundimonas sp.]|uniref:hypothetical protein n=1 Tax=Brevundimonas sp. TaxID=1871086 RepID=UPI0025FBB162|nr:hypothetical protein [Brevundimonas sp.]